MSLESVPEEERVTRVQANASLMESYLSELASRGDYARYLAQDATIAIMGTDQEGEGRAAVEQMIRYLHEQAFDATVERKNLFVTEAHATLEADFVGTHTGDFAGIPPTNRQVRVPYSVVYDVGKDQITALRIYWPVHALMAQIS